LFFDLFYDYFQFTFISQMQIMFVQSRSDNVNTSLSENREHIEKLNKKCNLLRKIQVSNLIKQCYVFLVTHYILFCMFGNFVGFSLFCFSYLCIKLTGLRHIIGTHMCCHFASLGAVGASSCWVVLYRLTYIQGLVTLMIE
jgi:hypothetical protein